MATTPRTPGVGTTKVIQLAPPKIVQKGAASAKVIGMMAVAVVISVVGAEVRVNEEPTRENILGQALSSPFLIVAGGAATTVVLVLLADFAGEPGETFGVGLAGVILLASVFIGAAPLWGVLRNLFSPAPKKGTKK